VRLRGRSAPSAVLFGPIETNLAAGRALSARHVAFYRRRAEGGTGLLVTEIASVHGSDRPYERAPLATECGPGWAATVEACRPHGTLVLAGLGHAGGQAAPGWRPGGDHRTALWAPSRVPDVVSREVPAPMEQPEIDELVAGFGAATRAATAAGCDGVEVNAGQHALLRQFLSPLTNHRTDGYRVDRARLLVEVLTEVRTALGGSGLLGLRLCADELVGPAGITPEGTAALLPALAPLLDYLVPVRGCALSVSATRPDLHTPPGFNRALCAGIRAASRGLPPHWLPPGGPLPGGVPPGGVPLGGLPPVVLQGSVVDVGMAAEALRPSGGGAPVADLVEMTRAQLAEPDLVALVRAGHPGRIRPCTLANQHAWVRDPRNPVISDEGEPATGHETEEPPVRCVLPAGSGSPAREVLVVGGGPAGLEAARVAALAGHRVRLVEAAGRLGGALRAASVVHGRDRLGLLADWLVAEVSRLGVAVRTGAGCTADELARAVRDGVAVLLCTGSRPDRPGFTVGPGAVVLPAAEFEAAVLAAGSGVVAGAGFVAGVGCLGGVGLGGGGTLEVLRGRAPGGEPSVLVHDPVGDWTGVGIAEQVAAAGVPTALVTPDPVAGTQLSRTGDLADANTRLHRAGVRRELYARLDGVRDGRAGLRDVHTGEVRTVAANLVIDCAQRLPEDTLWLAHPELARAGDCVAPRTVHQAVLEGRRIAQALGGAP
jgi:2,4-dienoyl-CoA reductase-like NADH-dependent reductase (Old Yellow Enzyme family)